MLGTLDTSTMLRFKSAVLCFAPHAPPKMRFSAKDVVLPGVSKPGKKRDTASRAPRVMLAHGGRSSCRHQSTGSMLHAVGCCPSGTSCRARQFADSFQAAVPWAAGAGRFFTGHGHQPQPAEESGQKPLGALSLNPSIQAWACFSMTMFVTHLPTTRCR